MSILLIHIHISKYMMSELLQNMLAKGVRIVTYLYRSFSAKEPYI